MARYYGVPLRNGLRLGLGSVIGLGKTSGPAAPSAVEYLVVAGGAGGGTFWWRYDGDFNEEYVYFDGAGGAGGVKTGTGLAVSKGTTYTVTVGAAGNNSVFSTITSNAGGGGASVAYSVNGGNGGSGGGAAMAGYIDLGTSYSDISGSRGQGSTVGGGQGNNGGSFYDIGGIGSTDINVTVGVSGGGGGAGEAGSTDGNGAGGDGIVSSISGSAVTYGGGGGGTGMTGSSTPNCVVGSGGDGGGGAGSTSNGNNGSANTGGGGGSAGFTQANKNTGTIISGYYTKPGGNGGSGIVIIRYADTFGAATATTGSPTYTVAGGYRIYKFTGSGSITW